MMWLWLALAVAPAALLATTGRQRAPEPSGRWADPDAPARIRAMAKRVEAQTNWLGLADYLVAVAYWESRGNSRAVGKQGELGWFQIDSGSRCFDEIGVAHHSLVHSEWIQVVIAACHAHVLGTLYTDFAPDWLAIRRGWKYPRLVSDIREQSKFSEDIRQRFAIALRAVGTSPNFMYRHAFPANFRWPGVRQIASDA